MSNWRCFFLTLSITITVTVYLHKNGRLKAVHSVEMMHPITCEAAIFVQCDFALFKHIVECRPATTRIILGVRSEEILVAHDALIDALLVEFVVFASEWTFGARFLCHLILDRCQTTAKCFLCFHFVSATRTTKWAADEVKRFTDECGNNWNTKQNCPLTIISVINSTQSKYVEQPEEVSLLDVIFQTLCVQCRRDKCKKMWKKRRLHVLSRLQVDRNWSRFDVRTM